MSIINNMKSILLKIVALVFLQAVAIQSIQFQSVPGHSTQLTIVLAGQR